MTPIGTELVTGWGERRIVVEVEDAPSYLQRLSMQELVSHRGNSLAALCIERGDGSGNTGRRRGKGRT